MQSAYQPDAESADLENHWSDSARSRRATISMDDVASDTLVDVMQLLITLKAIFRFEINRYGNIGQQFLLAVKSSQDSPMHKWK